MSFDPADRAQLPFLDALEGLAHVFLEEALALPDAAFLPLPDAAANTQGRWEVCLLKLDLYADDFPQALLQDNRVRCPQTWAAIAGLAGLTVAGFMRLAPGSEIKPHRDRREDDVIRVHVGLQLPEHERSYWPEGTARLMDIRQLHAARNPSAQDRLTLCCDFRLGVPVPEGAIPPWSPELSPEPPRSDLSTLAKA